MTLNLTRWALVASAGGFIGLAVVFQPLVLVALFLVAAAVVLSNLCFERYPEVFLGAVAWIYIQYFLTRDLKLLPQAGAWGDEACLFGLALGAFLKNLAAGRIGLRSMHGAAIFLSLLGVGIASGILNSVPTSNMILGLRGFLQPFLFYLIIAQFPFEEKFGKRVVRLVQWLVLLQVPICAMQYVTWNPSKPYMHEDASFGTFGFGTANILGWLLLAFIFHFAHLAKERLLDRRLAGFIMFALLFNLVLTSSRVALMMSAPLFLYSIVKSRLPYRTKAMVVALAAAGATILLALAGLLFEEIVPTDAESIQVIIDNQLSKKSGGGRVFWFLDTQTVVNRFSAFAPIGLGPGNYASYAGFTFGAPLLKSRLGADFDTPGTSFSPELTVVSSEFGILGLILFYALLFGVHRRANRLISNVTSGWWRALGETVRIYAMIMMIAPFTNTVWEAQFMAGTFWILAGVMDRAPGLRPELPSR